MKSTNTVVYIGATFSNELQLGLYCMLIYKPYALHLLCHCKLLHEIKLFVTSESVSSFLILTKRLESAAHFVVCCL